MPWKENHVIDQKREFVLESLKEDTNFTRLCGKYCISTKTGYKWKQRFLERGFAGLEDLSRKPQSCPGQLNEDEIIDILKLKDKKKHWGARKIRELYSRNYPGRRLPAVSTFNRLFKKAGLTIPRKRNRNGTGVRIENRVDADHPNHVWTVDFKGWWYTVNKEKVNPLTIRDDYSKYILEIKAVEKGDIFNVRQVFHQLFTIYGLPEIIRSDNGPPFANMSSLLGLTKFISLVVI